ncbi:MAG TPA: beta-L-arabinofuranosidase domain-containing protein [Acidobacteriaceae bacterium]|nr:beta-L-arabinofuranosidase domain-containing protein [Acidobacteriaceae bacterium]
MTTRRTFLQSAGLALAALCSRPYLHASVRPVFLEEFGYGDVTLAPGRALDQFENTQSVLMGLNKDSLLKPWRLRAGLPAPGVSLGGWYAVNGFCPGHTFGQWISALSRGYAATGDRRKQTHIDQLLALYQPAISGKFYKNFRFPAYVFDKVVCGMIDAHQFAHSTQAFPILDQTVDAALPYLPPHALDRDKPQLEWRASVGDNTTPDYGWDEPYTLPENLYLAWQRGAGARYKELAGRYLLDKTYFDPLAENKDVLANHHAYSFCNALSSAMEAYICTGSEKHLLAAKNAFEMISQVQSFATGGWGPNESFVAPGSSTLFDSLSSTHASFETPCGSYAHFKLTRYLLRVTRDGRYGDSMERVFYNTVLGAKRLEPDGHAFYYSDYNFNGKRVYFRDRWPCCSGTLPQVAADYHILGYFHEGNTVYVNLYAPSTLRWTTPDGVAVQLSQQSKYPLDGNIALRLRTSRTSRFAVRLRIPEWARGAAVRVNGSHVAPPVTLGFATLQREWKDGDRIELTLPLPMRLEPIDPQHSDTVALLRGPLVLFALNTEAPRVTRQQLFAAQRGPGRTLEETAWHAQTDSGPLRLVPFTGLGEDRYTTYLNVS